MPVNVAVYERLLRKARYNPEEIDFLVGGFTEGFPLGYAGDREVQQTAPNLKLECGSEEVLWEKMLKEVKLKRFAGPFEKIPFDNYIQSPVGLVPKGSTGDTRLIFHLSYPRGKATKSVNANNPKICVQLNTSTCYMLLGYVSQLGKVAMSRKLT